MKTFFTLIFVTIFFFLEAQSIKDFRLEQLYEEQFNHFYQSNFEDVLIHFDSIQIRTNTSSIESIQITIQACEELLKSNEIDVDKEALIIRKEYLVALLKWRLQKSENASRQLLVESTLRDQESFRKSYNAHTIYPHNNKFILNGEKYKLHELEDDLLRFKDSRFYYESYKKNLKAVQLLMAGTIVSYVAGSMIGEKDQTIGAGLFMFGFGCNLAAFPFMFKSTNHRVKSVWHYNREITVIEME